jgi:hypothetical protein
VSGLDPEVIVWFGLCLGRAGARVLQTQALGMTGPRREGPVMAVVCARATWRRVVHQTLALSLVKVHQTRSGAPGTSRCDFDTNRLY